MRPLLLVLALAGGMFAQLPNTVTATVSVNQALSAGTTFFRIQFVEATLASTIDSALAGLNTVGVTATQLTGVSVAINQGFVLTTYDFLVPVPNAEFTATRDKIIALQRTLATSQTQFLGWSSTQAPTDDQIAAALQQAMPVLLERAKQRAGILAQAMNATLGNITSLAAPAVSPDGPTVNVSLTATYAVTPN